MPMALARSLASLSATLFLVLSPQLAASIANGLVGLDVGDLGKASLEQLCSQPSTRLVETSGGLRVLGLLDRREAIRDPRPAPHAA